MKKYFFITIVICTTIYFLYIYYIYLNDKINKIISSGQSGNYVEVSQNKNNMKYILQWTSDDTVPFKDMGKGCSGFLDRGCPHNNCYVTSSRSYLGDYTKFDAIVFHGPALWSNTLPTKRSPHQKFVFASIESADNYQVCTTHYNSFFNWTWTYKLDSDIQWGYIAIKDKKSNRIIGPKRDMKWLRLEDMDPVPENFKKKLRKKKKAATWFVSNCYAKSKREVFFRNLEMFLLQKYKLQIDAYGSCSALTCPRDKEEECDRKIADNYFFYLSLENSFSEDYVTEKLLRALNNDAIPIVYGGANYTRFMPDGIYLNARELGITMLAEKMNELINDAEKYAEYFKWKNHYSYHKTTEIMETNEYCKMCEMLNNDNEMTKTTVYENFQEWWDGVPCSQG